MIAGQLEIQLLANLARLQKDMQDAKRFVGDASVAIEKHVSTMRSAFQALGLGISAAAFIKFAKDAIDAADSIGKLAQKTGIAVDELSKLKYAASLSDVSTESLAKGIKGLSQRMTEAVDGTSKAGKLMKTLGVDINSGASPAIERIADVFARLPDGTTKAALAVELFGKAGMDMIPLLNAGAAGIRKMKEEAERLGIVMDEQTAKAAEQFNDNMKAAGTWSERAAIAIMNDLSPAMIRVTRAIKQAAEESGILKAIWVAMGGVASEALGLNASDQEKLKANLKRAQEEVATLGESLSQLRKADLLAGVAAPGNMVEASFVRANYQLRLTQSTLDAIAGKYGDQVSRAQQQGRGVAGGVDSGIEARLKGLLAQEKMANDERQRDALETARLIQRGEEESAQESAEAWQYWDKFVLAEEKKALEERLALGDAYVREQEMAAEDVTEAWIYYNKFVMDQDRKRVDEARAQWGGFIDGIESAFRDSWNTIGKSWDDALDSMKNAFQRILLDFIYQSLAKPFVLSVVANLASSAGMSGLASMATSAAGSAVGGSSLASSAMSAAAAMGPVGWAALAVAAVAAVAYAFRDKGENWRAQFGFGENAMSPYSTQGVFGTEGFAQIQGQDAFARAMQEFMAGTRELDEVLARHLSADSIDRIVASLAGPYATRADGQPSEFAFARGQEGEAAAQLTLEYLQKKYGTIFDEIDGTFAEFIRSYTGKSEDLLAEIGAFVSILEQLSQLDIPGLDVGALRAMARDGEALGDTFARVSGEMVTMREQFLTDAEKLNLAKEALSGLFGDMALLGMRAPADNAEWLAVFESLDLATEAGREMHDRMVALSPAFLAVGDASERAAQQAQQAAATMLASFDSVMGQLRGSPYTRTVVQGQLDSALGQFQGANSWAQGMSLDALMGQLLTITRQDFQNYGADMQGLITQILTLYSSLQSLTDPISTVATTIGTTLAPAIDTAAIASGHLNARLALLAQIYELTGDAVSAAAIRDHQRAIALEEIRKQDSANGTPGILEGLTTSLWALQDAAEAAAALAREQEDAARGVIDTMQELVRMMDQVASFRESLAGSILSIRSSMPGFDAIGYQSGQVSRFRTQLAGAGSIEDRLAAGGKLRDAIMARYQAEMDAANALHQEQENAARAGIDAANELNRAFRSLGDYAKSLLTGDLSTLSPGQKLAESGRQYQDLLARARGGDMAALGGLQGAASDYLTQARGFYASSDSYVRIFEDVQGALTELGARAGPEQVYQENTAAWQSSLLEIQMRAIDELTSLESLTDAWQQELQEQLVEQAIVFSNIGLSTAQIAENTKDLDKRIASAINTAVAAAVRANGEIAEVQMEVDGEWYERQYDATKKLPGQLAAAVAVTDRR